jgi:hypothetical protein
MKHLNKFKTFENEQYIIDDILSVNEGVSSIIDKVKKYARKGLLSAAIITTLLASNNLSAQEKEQVKQIAEVTQKKPMFGTTEQRDAAKKKRLNQRKKNFDISVSNAYAVGLNMSKLNIVTEISEDEFKNGCGLDNEENNYLNGTTDETPSIVYREMEDGTKVKIDMNKYFKYVRKQNKKDDEPLDGLMVPNFKATSCGISKAHAKEDKKEWSKK